jgi:hypothetical protein
VVGDQRVVRAGEEHGRSVGGQDRHVLEGQQGHAVFAPEFTAVLLEEAAGKGAISAASRLPNRRTYREAVLKSRDPS